MRNCKIFIFAIFFGFSFVAEAQKRPSKKGKVSMQKGQLSDQDKLNYEMAFFNGLRQKALAAVESLK